MTNLNNFYMQSPDLNKERIEELQKLLPDIFNDDGEIDIQALKQLVGPETVQSRERFEFSWFGKSSAKRRAFTPSKAALKYDEKRSVNSNLSKGNMVIEGENLEVLKLLNSSYRESIKCIYIDPPYNTGNDFIYNDEYSIEKKPYWENTGTTENGIKIDTNTESTGRLHSNWLNFMFSRLLVARQLLSPDGIIFVSINEKEVHNLRLLMNEVFGESNFIEQIAWKNKYGAGAKTKGFIGVHENILCYSKEPIVSIEAELTDEQIAEYNKNKDEKYATRGGYVTQPLMTKSLDDRDNLQYTIEYDGEVIKPRKQWVWEEERLQKAIENNEVVFNKKKDGSYSVRAKKYLKNEDGTIRKGKPLSLLNGPFNQEGTKEIEEIFENDDIFSFPKPTELIKYLLSFTINGNESKDGIFLDFFAGSGTTAHAIMKLNKEDGGNRKFILVQLPEQIDEDETAYELGYRKISDLTIDRVKRVIEGYGETPEPLETGFKVYKLSKSNFERNEFVPNPNNSEEENLDLFKKYIYEYEANMDAELHESEIIDEVLLKNGFMLDYSLEEFMIKDNKLFLVQDKNKKALLCLDSFISDSTVQYLKEHKEEVFICLERALDSTLKWNLKNFLGDKLKAI